MTRSSGWVRVSPARKTTALRVANTSRSMTPIGFIWAMAHSSITAVNMAKTVGRVGKKYAAITQNLHSKHLKELEEK